MAFNHTNLTSALASSSRWGGDVKVAGHQFPLRSALDHAVWQLACRVLQRPPTEKEAVNVQFPIRRPDQTYPGRYGKYLSSADRKTIDPFQPDARGDDHHALSILNHLSNRDKHRVVTLTRLIIHHTELTVTNETGPCEVRIPSDVLLEDGAVVARFVSETKPHIHPDGKQAVYIAFADGTRATPTNEVKVGEDVISILQLLWNETRKILKAINATF